jgi:2'-5' RNA ligase
MSTGQCMIAYLPSDGSWCKQELPHMTLVYGGKTSDRSESDFNAMVKDAVTAARMTGSFSLEVTGVEEFGEDDEAVDVLTFYPTPRLLLARSSVKHWNASQYTDYKPHGTIGPAGSAAEMQYNYEQSSRYLDEDGRRRRDGLPLSVFFNRVGIFWDDKKIIFRLDIDY